MKIDKVNQQAAIETLVQFMRLMNDWERKFHPLMMKDIARFADQAVAELNVFYDRFVLKSDSRGRVLSPYPGDPPEYDPEKEPIEIITSDKGDVVVFTNRETGFKEHFRYRLRETDEGWKIVRKDIFYKSKGKWARFLL